MDQLNLIRLLSDPSLDVSKPTDAESNVLGLIAQVPAARPAALAALGSLLGQLHAQGEGGGAAVQDDGAGAKGQQTGQQSRKRQRIDGTSLPLSLPCCAAQPSRVRGGLTNCGGHGIPCEFFFDRPEG